MMTTEDFYKAITEIHDQDCPRAHSIESAVRWVAEGYANVWHTQLGDRVSDVGMMVTAVVSMQGDNLLSASDAKTAQKAMQQAIAWLAEEAQRAQAGEPSSAVWPIPKDKLN